MNLFKGNIEWACCFVNNIHEFKAVEKFYDSQGFRTHGEPDEAISFPLQYWCNVRKNTIISEFDSGMNSNTDVDATKQILGWAMPKTRYLKIIKGLR